MKPVIEPVRDTLGGRNRVNLEMHSDEHNRVTLEMHLVVVIQRI